jgi:putative membrane protein
MSSNQTAEGDFKKTLVVFLKGMAMGLADSVPGVSGGTIAVICDIYDEIIFSIRSVNLIALQRLFNEGVKPAWSYINGTFLLALLCGALLSLRLSASFVLLMLDNYFAPMMAFFTGLVICSCWYLKEKLGNWDWQVLVAVAGGVGLTLIVSSLSPQSGTISNAYLFVCVMVAICAMILPGLSGAFLLLMLGVYDYVLGALVSFDLITILIFAAGCVLGLLLFSRIIGWALKHYHQLSYAFLFGMLIASIYVLWPWQQTLNFYTDHDGNQQSLEKANVLPGSYEQLTGQDPQLLLVLLCLVSGCLLIVVFDKLFRKSAD